MSVTQQLANGTIRFYSVERCVGGHMCSPSLTQSLCPYMSSVCLCRLFLPLFFLCSVGSLLNVFSFVFSCVGSLSSAFHVALACWALLPGVVTSNARFPVVKNYGSCTNRLPRESSYRRQRYPLQRQWQRGIDLHTLPYIELCIHVQLENSVWQMEAYGPAIGKIFWHDTKFEQNFGAYISTFYVRTASIMKNR